MTFDDPTYLEAVYVALFDLLKTAVFPAGIAFNKTERAFDAPDSVPVADQPAMVLVQGPMPVQQKDAFSLAKWTLTALAVIYVRAEGAANQTPLPVTVANYIIWGIKNAFNTQPPYQKQTLGGLVYHAWIEGDVIPNVMGEQIFITVPIYVLAGPVGE